MANDPRFEVFPSTTERYDINLEVLEGYPRVEYRWRFRAANGQITAIGGEGFTRREDAERAVKHFLTDVGVNHEDTYVTPPLIDVDE